MRPRFPIAGIDQHFRSDNASGRGIRALAKATCIVSIDDEEFTDTPRRPGGGQSRPTANSPLEIR